MRGSRTVRHLTGQEREVRPNRWLSVVGWSAMIVLLLTLGFVGGAVSTARAQAGCSYTQNFDGFVDGTTNLGDGSVMTGWANIVGGQLELTLDGTFGKFASFSVPAMTGSSGGWSAEFDVTIADAAGENEPADGLSLNYGNAALGEVGSWEEGMENVPAVTENVSFEIDTWKNLEIEQGVNIAQKVAGLNVDLAFTNGPILLDGRTVTADVTATYRPDPAELSFVTNGLRTDANFNNVPTMFVGDDAYTFILSARVGGANQTVLVDNLVIECLPYCDGKLVTIDMNKNGRDGTGTAGNDVIQGTPLDDVITGGLGDDTICGDGGVDVIHGEDGADTIFGEGGADKLFGDKGADTIHGGPDDDTIHGNRGADTLYGDEGADRIFGYSQDDVIEGGPGNDRLHGNFGNDTLLGQDGDDRMFGYGDNDRISGGPGADLAGGNFGDDQLWGEADDDTLYGSDGADILHGGAGNDVVSGNSGADTVNGNSGDDTLDGGINVDICNGDSGVDTATRCETTTGVP